MTVLTIGTFDLLHFGQIRFLLECAKLGSLDVGVNTDRFVKTFKATPVMNQFERRYAIDLLWHIQSSFINQTYFNDSPGRELIEKVKPHILAVGSDWARKDYLKQIDVTQDWLDEKGIILAYIPYTPMGEMSVSATRLKERIREAKD